MAPQLRPPPVLLITSHGTASWPSLLLKDDQGGEALISAGELKPIPALQQPEVKVPLAGRIRRLWRLFAGVRADITGDAGYSGRGIEPAAGLLRWSGRRSAEGTQAAADVENPLCTSAEARPSPSPSRRPSVAISAHPRGRAAAYVLYSSFSMIRRRATVDALRLAAAPDGIAWGRYYSLLTLCCLTSAEEHAAIATQHLDAILVDLALADLMV